MAESPPPSAASGSGRGERIERQSPIVDRGSVANVSRFPRRLVMPGGKTPVVDRRDRSGENLVDICVRVVEERRVSRRRTRPDRVDAPSFGRVRTLGYPVSVAIAGRLNSGTVKPVFRTTMSSSRVPSCRPTGPSTRRLPNFVMNSRQARARAEYRLRPHWRAAA